MTTGEEPDDTTRAAERVTKAQARRTGIGEAPDGIELPAADPATESGAGFLGIGERADLIDRPDTRENS